MTPTLERKIRIDQMKRFIQTARWERVANALMKLFERQTRAEQDALITQDRNNRGFSAFDAEVLSSMAKFYSERGFLTEKQVLILRWKLRKYAGQLVDIAEELRPRRETPKQESFSGIGQDATV